MPTTHQHELDTCAAQRSEEWEVLSSIYPDCVSKDLTNDILKFEIPVELESPLSVLVTGGGTAKSQEHHLSLSSLPPVLLEIVLPPSYPLHVAPEITSFHVSGSWIPRSGHLLEALLEMWHPGEAILYTWVEWIRSADFLNSMQLIHDGVLRLPHAAPPLLLSFLTTYESKSQSSRFNQASHSCDVCLETRKGSRCLQLNCGHVFCRACLKDGWSLYIAEGDVTRVGCLDPQCVKEGQEADEDEVRRAVTEEETRRWKWLREKKAAEGDPSTVLCPMFLCQTPVQKPSGGDFQDGTGWERLRTCHRCNYSFCSFCKRTWHGPLSDCPIQVAEKLVIEYMETAEDSPVRKRMEQRYGKKNLEKLVVKYEEDRANREWLKKSTMACPSCHVHVEKSMGCNHMTCSKCKQHFCYRCGFKLQASNPYEHFSTLGRGCYSMLFDDVVVDAMEGFIWI
ncbi:RWD-domain-containing protein [Multifurca ochricompacta]|uniref:RBR-type E3 ubiquitin transferase n=1 Tax=Multifurca ochricompacta TaxID=376703 RepID=A0AAD4MC09_9AGAM|nr:RWD-domain-containing protein [Multifurca ochricompacta]